ncbi:putative zinc-binding protein [Methanomassiliicoccus luminyensis]|jgi:uncharacterized metal-binding protein|uniref:putative zinc-binding protein n=1 Tax=Methanomassiliicoccus luminyensis TaxID=1080712 RepID=UPI00037D76ED|nr:putative zinc-binding protein [Methanomassiliicoccus luminyensis]
MTGVNVVMCAGFSPSARMVRKALRKVSERADILVITPCPAGAGLSKYIEELKDLDPARTIAVEGCEACCGMQTLLQAGVSPSQLVVMEKIAAVDDKAVADAEERILAALKEVGP